MTEATCSGIVDPESNETQKEYQHKPQSCRRREIPTGASAVPHQETKPWQDGPVPA